MAEHGTGRRARHAAHSVGTTLHAAPHVRQCRSVLRNVCTNLTLIILYFLFYSSILDVINNCIVQLIYRCPPRTFLPALCRIFLDEHAPDSVLEVTARAITYYLDVSAECTRRVVAMEGAVKAICGRLSGAGLGSRASRDLAEQCIKVRVLSTIQKILFNIMYGRFSGCRWLLYDHAPVDNTFIPVSLIIIQLRIYDIERGLSFTEIEQCC